MAVSLGQRIVLTRSHDDPSLGGAQPYIVIQSGNTFGTGTHPTTRICVFMLEKIPTEGTVVLDIGTGTGILAICAAKLLAKHVVAIDHDFDACKIALHNTINNAMRTTVRVINGRLDALSKRIRFHIALANLELHALSDVVPLLRNHLHPSGLLVTSGAQKASEGDLANILAEAGFLTLSSLTEGDWIGFLAQKTP